MKTGLCSTLSFCSATSNCTGLRWRWKSSKPSSEATFLYNLWRIVQCHRDSTKPLTVISDILLPVCSSVVNGSVILTEPGVPSPRPPPAGDGGWWRAPAAWRKSPRRTAASLFPASCLSPLQISPTTVPRSGPKPGPQKTHLRTADRRQTEVMLALLC